ncbi:DUF1156 domain-containing protein [Accumulibacter sp.]|uniref:DUF1156 domain-containing protein n=1 Tax=Accumulibacter sp. TaxID=2053492 RepID=UPI001AC07E64|nr:DUF1156 domain-containing protein [Accumulibacter sp.]MBN8454479.1 DUF1156 domain-containing protein [Accumulibacter sp.]MBO3707012.1 DUF1156 domain-containing protein [Candidatus Accumulibacter conexus]
MPAQKVPLEALRERKAGAGQTLTALGSYWKWKSCSTLCSRCCRSGLCFPMVSIQARPVREHVHLAHSLAKESLVSVSRPPARRGRIVALAKSVNMLRRQPFETLR